MFIALITPLEINLKMQRGGARFYIFNAVSKNVCAEAYGYECSARKPAMNPSLITLLLFVPLVAVFALSWNQDE